MSRENSIPSGMSTVPVFVQNTVSKIGRVGKSLFSSKNNIVRVTAVDEKNGTILFEPLNKNLGSSTLGSPSPDYQARISTNTIQSVPFVGELVEIYKAPNISLAEDKNQATFVSYYKPAPIDVWQNQNNNVILDSSVQGQAPEDPMGDISIANYQRAIDGFAPANV